MKRRIISGAGSIHDILKRNHLRETDNDRQLMMEWIDSGGQCTVFELAARRNSMLRDYMQAADIPFIGMETPLDELYIVRVLDQDLMDEILRLARDEMQHSAYEMFPKAFLQTEGAGGALHILGLTGQQRRLLSIACRKSFRHSPYAFAETGDGLYTAMLPRSETLRGASEEAILHMLLMSNASEDSATKLHNRLFEALMARKLNGIVFPKQFSKHQSWWNSQSYTLAAADYIEECASVFDDVCINQQMFYSKSFLQQSGPCISAGYTENEMNCLLELASVFNVSLIQYQPAFEYSRDLNFR